MVIEGEKRFKMPVPSISALDDPIAIVHIPVSSSSDHTTELYWTIMEAAAESAEFFNVTSNRIEIAIFASIDLIAKQWVACLCDEVRISTPWRVFEISSGDVGDAGNYDSPHLRQVSAPLARAGISILYQSSYFTDFLLVKDLDFHKACMVFASQGWHVESSSAISRHQGSQLPSPITPNFPPLVSPSPYGPPAPPMITVLPSPLACVGFALNAERQAGEQIRQLIVWPERALPYWKSDSSTTLSNENENESSQRPFISYTRTEDGSSLFTEIRVLKALFPREGTNAVELQSGGELAWDTDSEDGDIEDQLSMMSPHKRTLSLPSIHRDWIVEGDSVGSIPILWSGVSARSLSVKKILSEKDETGGRKRCLQLDLRGVGEKYGEDGAYHLDKSGLVTLFFDLLDSGSVRMLYSSTFHTANILVEAGDVQPAKRLLERQ